MKYFSMFSGIGGFELGIKQAYDNRELLQGKISKDIPKNSANIKGRQTRFACIGYSEIDKYAIQIYEKHFNHKNYGDATKLITTDLPDFDLLVGGFPCQSFSIAGKRKGFNDTRGTLFFEIARVLRDKKPRYFLLENVKGLLSHDGGKTFETILGVLTEIGYQLEWQVLNSKNFGVPQNRERVFIVGYLGEGSRPKVFPIGESNASHLKYSAGVISNRKKWLEGEKNLSREFSQGQRIYDSKGILQTLAGNAGGQGGKTGLYAIRQPLKFLQRNQRNIEGDYSFAVDGANTGGVAIIDKKGNSKDKDYASTLTGGGHSGGNHSDMDLLKKGSRVRRLTPTECERLQGFPDGWTEGISDTQRYKCLGNAVTVNVIEAIIRRGKHGIAQKTT